MSLTLMTRRDPFAEFDAMIRRAFPARPSPVRTGSAMTSRVAAFAPAAEIVRDGDDALVKLDLPGLDFEKDISVELDGASLVISGERRDERTDDSDGRSLKEFRYGAFRRSFTLPERVTADALSASYDAGVLTVRVAGAYAGSEPQKITITGGKPSGTVDSDTVEAGTVESGNAADEG